MITATTSLTAYGIRITEISNRVRRSPANATAITVASTSSA